MSSKFVESRLTVSLAIVLPATYYIINTIGIAAHELGHLFFAWMLKGLPRGWYLAPAVFGYSWWDFSEGPVKSLAYVQILVTAGGVVTELVLGLVLIGLYLLLRNHIKGWFRVVIPLFAVYTLSVGVIYLVFSAAFGWGDGAQLIKLGIPFSWLILMVILVFIFLVLVGIPMVYAEISRYIKIGSGREILAVLIVMALPVYIYGIIKSYFLYPDMFKFTFAATVVFVMVACTLSAIGSTMLSEHAPISQDEISSLSRAGVFITLCVVAALEVGSLTYFGISVAP